MKHQWLAYVVVGLLSIGAGVAIAGLPDNVPVDATIVPPATSLSTTTTALANNTVPTTSPPATTDPGSTTPDVTTPDATSPEPTTPDTTDSVPDDLPERSELVVAAANGANANGAAQRTAVLLESLGYADVLSLNGSETVEFTVVYYADGFDEAALRLASDLDLLAEFVGPLDEAPAVADLPLDTELLVYVGVDRA